MTRARFPILFVLLSLAAIVRGQEPGPMPMQDHGHAQGRARRSIETAGEVGGVLARPPQAALPPADCWRCCGPMTEGYCLPGCGYGGFLYYGTSPYGDDPFNGLRDCPGGDCGNPAAAWTIRRIGVNNAHDPTANGHRR